MSMLTSRPSAGISKKHHCFSWRAVLYYWAALYHWVTSYCSAVVYYWAFPHGEWICYLPGLRPGFQKTSLLFLTSCPLLLSCLLLLCCPLLLSCISWRIATHLDHEYANSPAFSRDLKNKKHHCFSWWAALYHWAGLIHWAVFNYSAVLYYWVFFHEEWLC